MEDSIKKNIIITGDCEEVLKHFPSNSVDLILTSPPYFQQREYGFSGIGNERTEDEYLKNLYSVFSECIRVTKNTGAIVFNIGDKYLDGSLSLIPYKFAIGIKEKFNLKLINNITWTKLNPTPRQDKRKLVPSTEPFFVFAKSNDYYFDQDAFMEYLDLLKAKTRKNNGSSANIGTKYFELIKQSDLNDQEKSKAKKELEKVIKEVRAGNLDSFRMKIRNIHSQPFGGQEGGRKTQIKKNGFTIIRIYGKALKKDVIESPVESIKGNPHPAVYPVFIVQQIIKLLTKEGAVVLDPFNGSGTTCVAAKLLNRNYIGIEINSDYNKYANKRLQEIDKIRMETLFV